MQFSQMQTDALDLLRELQSTSQYSLAKLKHYINRGYYDFVRRTKSYELTMDVVTVADQETYTRSDLSDIVESVTITTAGATYSAGTLTFATGNATGTYDVTGGAITSTVVTSKGSGHTATPTVTPSDAGDGNAVLTAVMGSSFDYIYKLHTVRYIETGEIGEVLIPYPGGYSNLPEIKEYGTPRWYYVTKTLNRNGFEIGTWPINSVSSDTLRLFAFMIPNKELVADADIPIFPEIYHDALPYYAASRLFMMASHVRSSWGKKAFELKAVYDQFVAESLENQFSETDDNIQVLDVYSYDQGYDTRVW